MRAWARVGAVLAAAALPFTAVAAPASAATPQPVVAGAVVGGAGDATLVVSIHGLARGVVVTVSWGDGARTAVRGTCSPARATAAPRACGAKPRHTYATPGDYRVSARRGTATLWNATIAVGDTGTSAPAPAPTGWLTDMLDRVNAVRAGVGAAPLRLCDNLTQAAQDYAVVMAQQDWFDHTGPDGRSPWDRMEAAGYTGYRTVGENIAAGQQDVAEVMTSWINSPGHYANIINPRFTDFGAGRATSASSAYGIYWSQEFGAGGRC